MGAEVVKAVLSPLDMTHTTLPWLLSDETIGWISTEVAVTRNVFTEVKPNKGPGVQTPVIVCVPVSTFKEESFQT